jgi:hypothetical protein
MLSTSTTVLHIIVYCQNNRSPVIQVLSTWLRGSLWQFVGTARRPWQLVCGRWQLGSVRPLPWQWQLTALSTASTLLQYYFCTLIFLSNQAFFNISSASLENQTQPPGVRRRRLLLVLLARVVTTCEAHGFRYYRSSKDTMLTDTAYHNSTGGTEGTL